MLDELARVRIARAAEQGQRAALRARRLAGWQLRAAWRDDLEIVPDVPAIQNGEHHDDWICAACGASNSAAMAWCVACSEGR